MRNPISRRRVQICIVEQHTFNIYIIPTRRHESLYERKTVEYLHYKQLKTKVRKKVIGLICFTPYNIGHFRFYTLSIFFLFTPCKKIVLIYPSNRSFKNQFLFFFHKVWFLNDLLGRGVKQEITYITGGKAPLTQKKKNMSWNIVVYLRSSINNPFNTLFSSLIFSFRVYLDEVIDFCWRI